MTFNTPGSGNWTDEYPTRGGCSDPWCSTCYPDRASGGPGGSGSYGSSNSGGAGGYTNYDTGTYVVYPAPVDMDYRSQKIKVEYNPPSDKEYRESKPSEPPKESWCKCGARPLPNDFPKEFLEGLADFKEQWLERSNILERNELDKLKKSHDKVCFDRYISDTYAGYNDSALCYDL